jgi:hypothetical protein
MNELTEALRPLLVQFTAIVAKLPAKDVEAFGNAVTRDFSSFLAKARIHGDSSYERDIGHLKAQAMALLDEHQISVDNETLNVFLQVFEVIAKVALQALLARI